MIGLAFVLAMATGGRRGPSAAGWRGMLNQEAADLGFRVQHVTVQGGSGFSDPYIRKAADVSPGDPILGQNLDALRERVEQVGWVKSAKVVRLLPDTLVIAVKERPRLAVWQHGGATDVVDQDVM